MASVLKFSIPLNELLLLYTDAQTIVCEHFHVLNYVCVPWYPVILLPTECAKSVSCGLQRNHRAGPAPRWDLQARY